MRHIFVSVLGTTPAILTEAFYYYARMRKPRLIFNEIHVLTTTLGRDIALRTLLGNRPGQNHFPLLLRHLRVPRRKVTFDENHIYVFADGKGHPLDDVRGHEDSICVANQTCEYIRSLCSRRDVAVYATIAGGRKTMGVYLSLALQLYARPQDRLFHVLIDPRVESHPRFFFPLRAVHTKRGRIQAKDIRIDCDEIPFLHWPWKPEERGQPLTFRELQLRRQQELNWLHDPPILTINGETQSAFVGGTRIDLDPIEFLYYYLFAELRAKTPPGAFPLLDFAEFWEKNKQSYAEGMGEVGSSALSGACQKLEVLFNAICSPTRGRETSFAERLNRDFERRGPYTVGLSTTLSKIKKKVQQVVGPSLVNAYAILHAPEYGVAMYGLRLSPEKIRLVHPITGSA